MTPACSTYVVDDDPIVQLICKTVLSKFEVFSPVEVFFDGNDALAALQENNLPNFLFLDINMPTLNGWQLLQALEKNATWREIKVFVITSSIDPSDEQRALSYSAVKAFLPKPITREKVTELVDKLAL